MYLFIYIHRMGIYAQQKHIIMICIYIYILMRLSAWSFQAIPKMYKHVLKSIWIPTSHGLTVILLFFFYGVFLFKQT